MTHRHRTRGIAVGALAAAVGVGGLAPTAGAQESSRAAGGMPAALRLAVAAVGGAADLRGLQTFRYRTTAQRWILDEGFQPGGHATPSATVTSRIRYALAQGHRPERARIDSVRTSSGGDRPVHEVLSGKRGFIRGVDANFSSPATSAMTSDRWAALRKEQMVLNPQLLLRRAVRNPSLARNGGIRRIDGRAYRTVVLRNRVAPIRLFVDARTGRLARLRTTEANYLRRDVSLEVVYRRWTAAGAGLRFPRTVALFSDGERLLREQRSAIQANPGVKASVFRFPAGVGSTAFQPRLARIGERTSEWLLSFANLGFIKDGGQTAINPTAVTDGANTAQGITLLGGVANNSMIVERDNGIVVVEGALHNFRAEAVIRYIRRTFPGQRITHVITTHHHADHASGMRPYVALGATVVVGRSAALFFRKVFRQRNSTILPDRLDGSTVQARVLGVPAAGRSLAGAQSEIDLFRLRTDHSSDMIVPFVRDSGVIFVSDVYSPPGAPGAGGQALDNLIQAQNLNVQWIVGGHGTFISYADFSAALAAQ